jgi:Zn-finger nucleic acid-binding protein
MVDNLKDLKCPACQKNMKKIFISSKNIHLDICIEGCGGIYFDNRELNYFDEENESIDEILTVIEGKTFDTVNKENERYCPNCGVKMVKNFTSVKHKIQIDECYSCGARFLDAGEIQALRAEYKTEEERKEALKAIIETTITPEIRRMEEEHFQNLKKRSLLKKIYDAITGKI